MRDHCACQKDKEYKNRETKQSKASKRDRRVTQEGMKHPEGLKSFQEYRDWDADHCKVWQAVHTVYNEQEKLTQLCSLTHQKWKRSFEFR